MDDNISLPLILKYCFKDIKKDAGSENNNISAVCKKCSKTLKGSLISTTNFLNHIKRKGHGDLLTEYENLKSQTKTSKKKKCGTHTDENSASTSKKLIQSTLPIPTTLPVSINLDKLVIDFIIDTMSPISIVENKSFRTLIEGAQKLQNPPKFMCRRTCNKRIADMCAEYKANLKIKLKTVDYVCTTADVWSSSRRSYLGMTVHWIDPHTFERNSFTLACRRFKGTHTFDKVAELIIDIHTEYHLRVPKITKTVTDNGSNMLKAFKIYGKSELGMDATDGIFFSSSDIENISVNKNDDDHNNNNEHDDDDDETFLLKEFPESQKPEETYQLPNHERCTTHTLHLITSRDIIQARSQNISYKKLHDAAMAKCQAIWNLCSRSPKASEIYCETTGKSPTSPCPTRWNSYYNCIMDLLKVQETLNETLKKLGLSVFKEIELQFLIEYTNCTKPIAEAIKSLEGDKETFYGCLLPELIRIQKILHSLQMDNPIYCGVLIETIKKSLEKRFGKFHDLKDPKAKDAILASVSYPFFKLKWVPKGNREHIKELFLAEVRKLKNDHKDLNNTSQSSHKKEKNESYYMFYDDSDSSLASDSANANTTIDLESLQYLKDNDVSLQSLNKYPTVKMLFLKYNTCLPSSAPVERLFSYGGMIMRPHRRKMSDSVFEQIILLKSVK